ncbi:hypothetical protein KTE54_09210 [Burkholderia multivorans]|uniref:hypothetical protein n=1 Tax=Burkholderia multivorans TaxID=87883 RepID=UPI001C2746C8|nr:hypothetical protein [Burkholderia multivorans]MBU9560871.1 hypothetical protein [Burkholderia multivorans]
MADITVNRSGNPIPCSERGIARCVANSVETLKGKAAERWIDRDDGRDRSRKGGDLNADSWRDDAPA